MATLTVRRPDRRDWLRMRRVRQRRVALQAPWHAATRADEVRRHLSVAMRGIVGSSDAVVADVDGELCAYAMFDRGDERFRWYVTQLGAGSPRVDATDEVAVELWSAVLEEGIVQAGEAGARRIFAFAEPETAAFEALRLAGYAGYSRYYVLRGRMTEYAAESPPVREQHESDLWSIHQLYNHTTPRGVQFAEAFTSDAWSVEHDSRNPFNRPALRGFVVPREDGVGAACQIAVSGQKPVVTFLCDEALSGSIAAVVSASVARLGIDRDVDVIVPGYQHELISQFLDRGLWINHELVGTVRHTTVTAIAHAELSPVLATREARSVVPASFRPMTSVVNGARLPGTNKEISSTW